MSARYPKCERGQVLILVALSLVVLMGFVGLAIDSGRGYGVKAKLNAAVDTAAIAGARALAEGNDDAERIAAGQAAARNYYAANFPANYQGSALGAVTVDAVHDPSGYWRVTATGSANMPVTFMAVLGFNDLTIRATGQTIRRDLDVILVLDTSGSLGPPTSPASTFPTLKNAAINSFVNRLNAGSDRVGLVSFAAGGVVDVPIVKTGARGFSKTQVVNAINALNPAGYTASAEGMRLALNELNGVPMASRSSLRMIVFFSDGAPNAAPANFSNGGIPVIGDLESGTSGPGTARATEVYRFNRRDSQLGSYPSIATLPNSGFTVTGFGDIPLASYNNKRTLTGAPYINDRCNVNKAARSMVENAANMARDQVIKIYSIGFGTQVNNLEITFCGYGADEQGSSILKRLANAADSDSYNSAQPVGRYVWAADAADLDNAFSSIASEILRLTM